MAVRRNTNKKEAVELPFNADAERVVLGSAMLKKDYCLDVLKSLEQNDFFLAKHQVMYSAISSNTCVFQVLNLFKMMH